jgi:plasmid stabilization system protein ParE
MRRADGLSLVATARRDLDDIARHISRERDAGTAERVVATVIRSLRMLSDNPLAGRSRRDDLGRDRRSIAVTDYVIIYRVVRSDALILRVLDGRRDLMRIFGH